MYQTSERKWNFTSEAHKQSYALRGIMWICVWKARFTAKLDTFQNLYSLETLIP